MAEKGCGIYISSFTVSIIYLEVLAFWAWNEAEETRKNDWEQTNKTPNAIWVQE